MIAPARPLAIVLSCAGAPEGALNAVRALGECGVPVLLVTEEPDPPHAHSRHVTRHVALPGFTMDPEALLRLLRAEAAALPARPVVLPTADPDLHLLMRLRERLDDCCAVLAPERAMGETLADKIRFAELAERLALPVPATRIPDGAADVARVARSVTYPVIVKPANPAHWHPEEVPGLDASVKAIRVEDAAELEALGRRIADAGFPFVVQEYIPGPDAAHVDLHALVARDGRPVATFTGRKHRLFPAHAGAGTYVESTRIEAIVALGLDAMHRIGYTGLANINFKQDARTGAYWLLEINPRLSHWNILTTRSGINLPHLAWAEAAGLPLPASPTQQSGGLYVNFYVDRQSYATYHREGDLSLFTWLRTIAQPWRTTYQVLQLGDPGPFLVDVARRARARRRRAFGPAAAA